MRLPIRDKRGSQTASKLVDLVRTVSRSGNPDEPFYYLGGPMSEIPQFNFPRFHEAADTLRQAGYNIVSPAELDDPEVSAQAMASETGDHGTTDDSWEDFLSRDLIVCSLPNCVGGIFLEGWWFSDGALGESWVLNFLGKRLFAYSDDVEPCLRVIDDRQAEIDLQLAASKWSCAVKPWKADPQWLESVRRNGGYAKPVIEHVEGVSDRVRAFHAEPREFHAEAGHTPGLLAEED